ncbi:MAG: DNA repair exonuclease [Candidatus Pacearchaeota archaeon]|nr:DNA repair exonuclease [Candidatus Pacearchaeota archaeon]
MKFAHMADCHLGCWRQKEMQQLNLEAFKFAIDCCIKENVSFVIIAGDLFDTAIPSIEILKEATSKLKELADNKIPCYVVPGSHDFSISGKSMIHVLEKAGLLYDTTTKSIENENYSITGVGGEKKGLEIKKIKNIQGQEITNNNKFNKTKNDDKLKILILHTALTEMNLPFINSLSMSELPQGFDYYALGHIHDKRILKKEKNKAIAYPGALFPCNFSELEKNGAGSFFIINYDENDKGGNFIKEIKEIKIKLKETLPLEINADNETSHNLYNKIIKTIENNNIKNKIVLLRIFGTLASGKPSEINFKELEQELLAKGAYCILRNTSKLVAKEFELESKEINIDSTDILEIEKSIIKEMALQKIISLDDENKIIELMSYLDIEKAEGETNETFAFRIFADLNKKLNLNL